MKLKLWLHRLRGLKIKGFQRRSMSTAAAATSVCHLDSIEKSTVNSSVELTPVNYRKSSSTHNISISPKVGLSLSPTSPLPSPALLNTPNGRSSSSLHVLKESLAFDSGADYAIKNKPYNKFAQVVASLGCGSSTGAPDLGSVSLRNGRSLKNSKAFGGISKGFKDEDGIKVSLKGSDSENTMEINHKEEGSCCLHQASTQRWAGACRCMLVNVEKGFVRSKRGRSQLKKKQSKHTESTKLILPSEHKLEIKDLNIADYHPVLLTTTSKEPHFVMNSTQPAVVKAAELVEKRADWKSDITEVTVSRRWSSASVRDCYNGNSIPSEPKLVRSTSSYACSKEQSSIANYDDNLFITSCDRGRPSESSMSTLSSDEFDKLNHWGSCDSKNGLHLTHGHWQEELGNLDQKIRKNSQRSDFSLYNQGIISANTQSGLGLGSDHEEDEQESLLQADSYATCSDNSSYTWLHQNIDDDDASYLSTLADLEANAKAWATWVSSSIAKAESNYGSSIKHDYVNSVTKSLAESGLSSRIKSRRELDAAALRRKYHKAFGQQAVVVSSHHGDNMNTFVFPSEIPARADSEPNPSQVITEKLKENINIHSQRNQLIIKVGLDSLAVEKRSQDPYVDFRDSMVDMILQNQMHKSSDLEELLQSFLSLNSLEHHDLIVQAFTEVWEKVFGNFSIRKP